MKNKIDLNLYLNHWRNAVVIARPEGIPLFKNEVFDLLFTKGEKSGNIFDLLKKNPLVVETARKVIDIRGSYFLREIPIKLANGTCRNMDVETFPLIDHNGDLLAVNIIFHDHSDQTNIEAHKRRIDRVHYLKTIAAGLAHEIKNPLSGIKGASQLLTDALKGDKDLKEYSEIIQKEVVRVDKLLKDLLHFTKPAKLKKKKTNVNQILHELVLLQKTVAPQEIKFLENFDPSLPVVDADPEALSQIFLNMVKNARQAIDGNGCVTITSRVVTDFMLRKGAKKKQFICIDIEDSGEGIEPDDFPNIFVPFFTTKPKGIGLGLAVCHQLVEEHEGDIRVRSENGKGTIFSVYLPV